MHDELVTIARFPNEEEAEMAQGLLAENGIEAILVGGDSSMIQLDRVFGVTLRVTPARAEEASQLLDDLLGEGDDA